MVDFLSRVVVQNERYDDWTRTLMELKTLFNQYLDTVLHYHERAGQGGQGQEGDHVVVPPARNSTASEGNFLEVLNMGLNSEYLRYRYIKVWYWG